MSLEKMSEKELEFVTGGQTKNQNKNQTPPSDIKKSLCPVCKEERIFHLYLGGRAICQTCGKEKMM